MNRSVIIWTALLTLTTSCTLTGGNTHLPNRFFDFGPHMTQLDQCDSNARLNAVTASPSLQGSRMWYRYVDALYEPVPYAISQWSAPPGVLTQRMLAPAFSQSPVPVELGIELEIQQLELQIDTNDEAQVFLSVYAKLHEENRHVASRRFTYSRVSLPSPGDAAKDSAAALAELALDLCAWTRDYKPDAGL